MSTCSGVSNMVRPPGLEPGTHGLKESYFSAARKLLQRFASVNDFLSGSEYVENTSHRLWRASRSRHVKTTIVNRYRGRFLDYNQSQEV